MKKSDVVFLTAVLGVAGAFSLVSLSHAVRILPRASMSAAPVRGVAGEARDVDMERLQELLRRNYLSDREAEFYKVVPEGEEEKVEK